MGCHGTAKPASWRRSFAAAVLGGEISIGAAIASDEFVKAPRTLREEPPENESGSGYRGKPRDRTRAGGRVSRPRGIAAGFTYASNQDAANALVDRPCAAQGHTVAAYQADARDFSRACQVVGAGQDGVGSAEYPESTTQGSNRTGRSTRCRLRSGTDVIDTNLRRRPFQLRAGGDRRHATARAARDQRNQREAA
jgi:hypothetical protein